MFDEIQFEGTRIYAAGCHAEWEFSTVHSANYPRLLISYAYLQKDHDLIVRWKDRYPEVEIMVDSGAFTFFAEADKGIEHDLDFYEDYADRYIEFLDRYSEYICAAADLDIYSLTGDEFVERLQTEHFLPFERSSGVPICYVWHPMLGIEGWVDMCSRFDYVGIGSSERSSDLYNPLMRIARDYLTKVHVMGYAETLVMHKWEFFSVDQTTWLVGKQFADLCVFDGRRIKRLHWKDPRAVRRYEHRIRETGAQLGAILGGDVKEACRSNLMGYARMEEALRRRIGHRAYWNKRLPYRLPKDEQELRSLAERVKVDPDQSGLRLLLEDIRALQYGEIDTVLPEQCRWLVPEFEGPFTADELRVAFNRTLFGGKPPKPRAAGPLVLTDSVPRTREVRIPERGYPRAEEVRKLFKPKLVELLAECGFDTSEYDEDEMRWFVLVCALLYHEEHDRLDRELDEYDWEYFLYHWGEDEEGWDVDDHQERSRLARKLLDFFYYPLTNPKRRTEPCVLEQPLARDPDAIPARLPRSR